MKRKILTSIIMVLVLATFVSPANAQQDRPKIGLSLSGGGARGLAHIGVIRLLEEMNIPIDYIAGTSMGAIVGGLYASGMTLDEIEELVVKVDWNNIIADQIPRGEIPIRKRMDDKNYILEIEVSPEDGIVVPQGLVAGKRLDFLLRSLTLGVPELDSFDRLPVPFRAVTANIENGEMVILDHGDLAKAIRASMAVPGVFSPVEIDGVKLVDGGIARNMPVDVVRDMGADIVITVDISTPFLKRDDIADVLNISSQISRILTYRNVTEQIRQMEPNDILISPELGDISTFDFDKGQDAMAIGYDAAGEFRSRLEKYSLSDEEYESIISERNDSPVKKVSIDFVNVADTSNTTSRFIENRLKTSLHFLLGSDKDSIAYDIFRIYEQGDLDSIDFSLIEEDGQQGLLIEGKEKSSPKNMLRVGLELSDDFEGDSSFNLLLNHTMEHVNDLGAEWKNELQFGEKRRLFTEFYQPLDNYPWALFVAPSASLENYPIDLFDKDDRIAEYRTKDSRVQFDLGVQLANFGQMRAGVMKGKTKSRVSIGAPSLQNYDLDRGAYVASLSMDQLDNRDFPLTGIALDADFEASREKLGADDTFKKMEVELIKPFTYGNHTLAASADFGTTFGSYCPMSEYFSLGGFLNLSGLRTNELRGQHYLLGKLVYYYKIWDFPKVSLHGIYLGASVEAGNTWIKKSDMSTGDVLYAGSVFMGVESVLGPVYLGFGVAEGGNNAAYLMLGQRF